MLRVATLSAFLLAVGCDDTTNNDFQTPPAVAPLVVASMPDGFKPDAMASWLRSWHDFKALISPVGSAHAAGPPTVDEAVKAMFKDMYNNVSGTMAQGLVNSDVLQLDQRVTATVPMVKKNSCFSKHATTHLIDLSPISPGLKLTVEVQCTEPFGNVGGMMNTSGKAGIVFGSLSDSPDMAALPETYSLWLNVDGAGMGSIANVISESSKYKHVDMIGFLHEAGNNRVGAYHIKAYPRSTVDAGIGTTQGKFELACGGACSSTTTQAVLNCGVRVISDGVLIWAEGNYNPMGDCTTATFFSVCYNALTLAPSAGCDILKTSFTMGYITNQGLAGNGPLLDSVLALATASSP